MRICDGMSSLEDISAITALTQGLAHDMSLYLEADNKIPVMHAWYRVENKWRAARYGLDANIILNAQGADSLTMVIEAFQWASPTGKLLFASRHLRMNLRIV